VSVTSSKKQPIEAAEARIFLPCSNPSFP